MAGNKGEVVKSLVVNAIIASSKGVAAGLTGSGAMLAETLHSFADCGNQLLLLVGLNQSRRAADAKYPLGHGRQMYFYSFIVALLLFCGGGVFSIYEGIHKLREPEAVGDITVALVILGISILLEGWSTLGNIKVLNARRGATPFFRHLKETKDSDLIVVFGENSAAVLGLVLAGVAIVVAKLTNDGRWDAAGSIAIGLVLVMVAAFLGREVKSLLVGESADPKLIDAANEIAHTHPHIEKVLNILSIQQGPGEIMVAMKLQFKDGLTTQEIVAAINDYERKLEARNPEVKWTFIEPDNVA
ncbi:MAG: cation diffusion facilitator family transporter [Deltaproteobacteria bacterium]|nr:cation diffusion facilitator family transporter [Deltaproteobacteria bacterium]MCW5806095.1 cation diffusion facilitator family transporter [Deltaproteobacteria bacterium]